MPRLTAVTCLAVLLITLSACPDPGLGAVVDLGRPRIQSPREGACVTTTTNPIFAWSAAGDARSYGVEVSTDSDLTVVVRRATEIAGTSVTFGDPFPADRYHWQVTASDGRGNFSKSDTHAFVVAAGMPPLQPSLPEELGCGLAPTVSWADEFAGDRGLTYEVEVSIPDATGARQVVISETGIRHTQFELQQSGLEKGRTYDVRVRRVLFECPGPWAEAGTFTMLGELTAPVDPVASHEGCGPFEALLSWTYEHELPEAAVFALQVDAGCGNIQLMETKETELSMTFDSAATVWWRVRVVEDDGHGSHCASSWAEGERFTMVSGPAAPSGLEAGWDGCGPFDASLRWEQSDLPEGAWYEVEIEGELGFSRVIETSEAELELVLAAADTYSWRVRIAQEESGEHACDSSWAEGSPIRTGSGRSWTRLAQSAAFDARESHGVISDSAGEALYVIAGNASGDVSDVWRSTDGAEWEMMTADAGFSPRRWFGSTWFDDRLWVAGGIQGTGGANRDDVWFSYDGATWTRAHPHGTTHFEARHAPSLLAHDGKLWVIAGEGPNCHTRADVWSSSDGYVWERVTANGGFPSRDWHGAVVFKERMWVIGGLTRSSACSETYLSDVWSSADGESWTLEASGVFPARGGHATVVFDDKIWVIGGTSAWPGATQSDVWYTSDGSTWCRATDRHDFSNRYGLAAGVVGDRLFVIGGFDGQLRGDVWVSD